MPGPFLADSSLGVFESPQEGKQPKGGTHTPRALFLKRLDSSKSRGCPCPLSPFPTPCVAFPESTSAPTPHPPITAAGQTTSSSGSSS